MKSDYLKGVNSTPSSFPKINTIGSGINAWYVSAYETVKSAGFERTKKEIIDLTNSIYKRSTSVSDWDWHHVVESQHMVQINSEINEYNNKWYDMPTVLIHKPEHRFLSQNFNTNAFRELTNFTKERNSIDQVQSIMIEKINNFEMMYENMYMNYPTLKIIAKNVFKDLRSKV